MMVEMIRFGDFASFKYGKMPNKKKVTEIGTYPVYSGYRYVGFYDEYNTEANQLIIAGQLDHRKREKIFAASASDHNRFSD